MRLTLKPPSFWSEPRDPDAWIRALGVLAKLDSIPSPFPCWEKHLRPWLSRRGVPGLYGLRLKAQPLQLLGVGFIEPGQEGWQLSQSAHELLDTHTDSQPEMLARLVVRRSPWLRLLLLRLQEGSWSWQSSPTGLARLQISRDLVLPKFPFRKSPPPAIMLGDQAQANVTSLKLSITPAELVPLQSPIYLLQALDWLDRGGYPQLPDDLQLHLGQAAPAVLLRQLTHEIADRSGFVPIERVGLLLWRQLHPNHPPERLAAWIDQTFGEAINRGTIEVDAWAPGQPRHGRGLYGDRDRKLVRWIIHNNFSLPLSKPE